MTAYRPEADINLAVAEEVQPLAERPRTVWRDAWDRLRGNTAVIACAVILGVYVLIALVAFTGVLNNAITAQAGASYATPSFSKFSLWLGTDFLGRSVVWRLLYGCRIALTVAVLSALISSIIGTTLGLIAGYFGGFVDSLVIWLFSTVSSIPWILLIMALAFVLKGQSIAFTLLGTHHDITLVGIPTIVLALGLTSWVGLCRYVRGEALKLRERDYVAAARAVGLSDRAIVIKHILPNVFHLIIIDFSLGLAGFVQAEVVLSFLGLGVVDAPSWGRMIDDAKLELLKGVWWQMAGATIAIFIFSLAVNILGDALRDALDPRLRGVS